MNLYKVNYQKQQKLKLMPRTYSVYIIAESADEAQEKLISKTKYDILIIDRFLIGVPHMQAMPNNPTITKLIT